MTLKAKIWVSLGLLAGLFAGGVLGHYLPSVMMAIGFLGKSFISLLMIISFLILVTSLVNGVTSLGDQRKLGFSIGKSLTYFLTTSLVAGLIGVALGYWLKPGFGVTIPLSSGSVVTDFSWETVGLWLGAALLSVILAIAMMAQRMKSRSLMSLFKSTHEILVGLCDKVMLLAPVGVMSYIGFGVAEGSIDFGNFISIAGQFGLTIGVGLAIYLVILLPVSLIAFGGGNIPGFFGSLLPAALTGMSVGSSRAAMPFVLKAVSEGKRYDERAVNIAVPMGSLFNVGPTLMTVLISVLFVSQAMAINLSVPMLLAIGVVTIFLSIGLAGAPGMIAPIMALALTVSGAPIGLASGVAVIIALSWLIEPLRALANVYGDASGAAVLSETFEFKTALRSPARAVPRKPYGARSDRRDRSPARGRSGPRRESSGKEKQSRTKRPAPAKSDSRSTRTRRPDPQVPAKGKTNREPSPFEIDPSSSPALEINSGATGGRASSKTEGRPSRSRRSSGEGPKARPTRSESVSESPARGRGSRSAEGTSRPSRRSSTSPERNRPTEDTSVAKASPSRSSSGSDRSDSGSDSAKAATPSKQVPSRERIESDLVRVSKQLRKLDENLKSKVEESEGVVEQTPAEPVDNKPRENESSVSPASAEKRENEPVKTEPTPVKESAPVSVEAQSTDLFPNKAESSKGAVVSTPAPEKISAEERELAAGFGRGNNQQPDPNSDDISPASPSNDVIEAPSEDSEPESSSATETPKPRPEPAFGRTKRKKRLR